MMRQRTMAVLATLVLGMLIGPALASHDLNPPSATITAPGISQYNSGQDVKFTASLSSNPGHAVVILVKWKGPDRYWRLQPDFHFSFPCNLTNRGSHTITIQTSNDTTNEATCDSDASCAGTDPTAYEVGSPSSATATCNL